MKPFYLKRGDVEAFETEGFGIMIKTSKGTLRFSLKDAHNTEYVLRRAKLVMRKKKRQTKDKTKEAV